MKRREFIKLGTILSGALTMPLFGISKNAKGVQDAKNLTYAKIWNNEESLLEYFKIPAENYEYFKTKFVEYLEENKECKISYEFSVVQFPEVKDVKFQEASEYTPFEYYKA